MGKKNKFQTEKICSALGCQSTPDRNTSFHIFPNNLQLQQKWKKVCNFGQTQKITKNYYICSKHFLPTDYCQGRRLKHDAVPTENWAQNSSEKIFCENQSQHDISTKPFKKRTSSVVAAATAATAAAPQTIDINSDSNSSDDEPLSKLVKRSTSIVKLKKLPTPKKKPSTIKIKTTAHKLVQTIPDLEEDTSAKDNKMHAEQKNIIWSIICNEQILRSWTGMSYFAQLESVEEYAQFEMDLLPDIRKITTLSVKEKILLVFIKLTTNLTYMNIAGMFNITHYSVGRVFHSMLPILKLALESSAFFPSYDEITEKINVLLRSTNNEQQSIDNDNVTNNDKEDEKL